MQIVIAGTLPGAPEPMDKTQRCKESRPDFRSPTNQPIVAFVEANLFQQSLQRGVATLYVTDHVNEHAITRPSTERLMNDLHRQSRSEPTRKHGNWHKELFTVIRKIRSRRIVPTGVSVPRRSYNETNRRGHERPSPITPLRTSWRLPSAFVMTQCRLRSCAGVVPVLRILIV
jgi:hypothetical protein